MTDDRLERLLAEGPPGDDDATGLAGLARTRQRARRRTTLTVAAAVLAVAAVPVTATVLGGDGPARTGRPAATSPAPTPEGPTDVGIRVESWRDLTADVPSSWGYGGGTDWCASDGSGTGPEVVRPGGGVREIGCTPQQGYGLYFGDSSAISWARDSGDVWQYGWESPDQVKVYPEDAWLGLFRVDDHYALVVTRDEETTRAVLGSVQVVDGADPNGCPTRDRAATGLGVGERWSVCGYAADGWLRESRLLTDDESAELAAAIAAAPLRGRPENCGEPERVEPVGQVLVGSGGPLGVASIVFESWCPDDNGIRLSGTTRELTEDVMRFALTPGWSGGLDGSVPVPQEPGSDR